MFTGRGRLYPLTLSAGLFLAVAGCPFRSSGSAASTTSATTSQYAPKPMGGGGGGKPVPGLLDQLGRGRGKVADPLEDQPDRGSKVTWHFLTRSGDNSMDPVETPGRHAPAASQSSAHSHHTR